MLSALKVTATAVSNTAHMLVEGPHRLTLFIRLTRQNNDFGIIADRTLTRHCLSAVIQTSGTLNSTTVRTVRAATSRVLDLEDLTIPRRHFSTSRSVRQGLYDLGILQRARSKGLAFKRRALLSILIVDKTIQANIALGGFVRNLPPIPFMHPDVHDFITRLTLNRHHRFEGRLESILANDTTFRVEHLMTRSFTRRVPRRRS